MAWNEIGGAREYVKYAECKVGDVIAEGWYKGPQEGRFGRVNHIRKKDGKTVCLNSSGHLNWLLDQVPVDSYIQVIYDGEDVLGSGRFKGKMAHRFKCFLQDGGGVDPTPVDPTMPDTGSEDDPLA